MARLVRLAGLAATRAIGIAAAIILIVVVVIRSAVLRLSLVTTLLRASLRLSALLSRLLRRLVILAAIGVVGSVLLIVAVSIFHVLSPYLHLLKPRAQPSD